MIRKGKYIKRSMMDIPQNMSMLVSSMIVSGTLKSENLIDAFNHVDRRYFVPMEYVEYTYVDTPMTIGSGQTISQPSTVAFMLEQLDVHSSHKVLDIGSGSGWTTALLCYLVGEEGSVIGLERFRSLVDMGRRNLSQFNTHDHCEIRQSGDALGIPDEQFDRILVSASAEEIPKELFAQLKIGGVLVIPVQESIYKFTKISEDEISQEEFYGFRFVPLVY